MLHNCALGGVQIQYRCAHSKSSPDLDQYITSLRRGRGLPPLAAGLTGGQSLLPSGPVGLVEPPRRRAVHLGAPGAGRCLWLPCGAGAIRLHVSSWFAEINDRLRRLAVNRADARGIANRTRDDWSNESREGVHDHVFSSCARRLE